MTFQTVANARRGAQPGRISRSRYFNLLGKIRNLEPSGAVHLEAFSMEKISDRVWNCNHHCKFALACWRSAITEFQRFHSTGSERVQLQATTFWIFNPLNFEGKSRGERIEIHSQPLKYNCSNDIPSTI